MKNIAILGTGMVGTTIADKLIDLGYTVKMGSRTATNEKAKAWVSKHPERASQGTFDEASAQSDLVILCTKGMNTLDAVKMIKKESVKGKVILDITNPLDFSKGMPPSLVAEMSNTNSLAEEIQKELPDAHIVKSLNIVNCEVMVNPAKSGGDPTMFMSGNDQSSKSKVKGLLEQFGWKDIIDLGDITTARGTEMLLPLWIRTWVATQNGYFAFKVVR